MLKRKYFPFAGEKKQNPNLQFKKAFKIQLAKIHRAYLFSYCVRYPHAMPFLWNKMPYFLLKTPKAHTA